MNEHYQVLYTGLMALLMGLLLGIEREHSQRDAPTFAGARTFPLIALIGFLSGLLFRGGVPWVLPVALGGVCAMAVAAYVIRAQGPHKGATTEFVGVLAFILGAMAALSYLVAAAAFAVVAAILLSIKAPLHRLAERIKEDELYAVLKFGIVSLIILPLLPNRTFGPLQVLNPRLIWWVVVLISGISMVGYVLMRLLGARQGIAITGLLGGLVSSTATTVGLSQKARESQATAARYFAIGIIIASTIMFLRMLILTSIVNHSLGRTLILPIMVPVLIGAGTCVILWKKKEAEEDVKLEVKNPMELGSAIKFGLFFAAILFIARASQIYLGTAGFYLTSALAGLTDVDAITVSAASLSQSGLLESRVAGASILLAAGVNSVVKGGIVVVMGGKALRSQTTPVFAGMVAASILGAILMATI